MPITCQLTIGVRSGASATISPSSRSASLITSLNHLRTLAESPVTGRVMVMFDQVMREGRLQVNPLLPPSAYCSTSTVAPRPSQVWNVPRSSSAMVNRKKTLLAKTSSLMGVLLVRAG